MRSLNVKSYYFEYDKIKMKESLKSELLQSEHAEAYLTRSSWEMLSSA